MTPIHETPDFLHFHKHVAEGSEYVIHENGLYIFANGARCNPVTHWGDAPPSDPERLYRARKAFFAVRLQKTKANYERRRRDLAEIATHCAATGLSLPFGEEEVTGIKNLKTLLDRYQAEYDEFTADETRERDEWERDEQRRRADESEAANRVLRQLQAL